MIPSEELRWCKSQYFLRLCAVIAALLFAAPLLSGSSIPAVTGTYNVLQQMPRGSQAQIRMRIHLLNPGPSDLFIQRMTLSILPHLDRGFSRACALTVRAQSSVETSEEFTISRSEYQLWRRGLKPRLVLQVASASGRAPAKSVAVVLEDGVSPREAR
jgi:hypothetical protein